MWERAEGRPLMVIKMLGAIIRRVYSSGAAVSRLPPGPADPRVLTMRYGMNWGEVWVDMG